MARGSAPNATRTPNSRVRRATMYAITPYRPIVPSTRVIAAAALMSVSVSVSRAVDARTTSLIGSALKIGTVGSRSRTRRLTAGTTDAGGPAVLTTRAIVRRADGSVLKSIGTTWGR